MDSVCKLYLERAQNELKLSKIIFQLSSDKDVQIKVFNVSVPESFFSAVITHSYYSIFYSAKAYLMKKGIVTKPPEEHKKTYYELKSLVDKGILDVELLMIYEQVLIRADTLLGIFRDEKRKRGNFTYQNISQANIDPATDSLKNSKLFFKHVYNLCDYDSQK